VEALVKQPGVETCCQNSSVSPPIHLAILGDHRDILKVLLDHDPSLVSCVDPANGFYPLHTAAKNLQKKCAELLIEHGAMVNQLTVPREVGTHQDSVFHLAARTIVAQSLEKEKNMTFLRGQIIENQSQVIEGQLRLMKEKNIQEQTNFAILDLFLKHLPRERIKDDVTDGQSRSLIHYFAIINYATGIKTLASAPFLHPPDLLDHEGKSPLLVALNMKSLNAVQQLLEYDVDVERLDPKLKLTPFQLLFLDELRVKEDHLEIVDKLLEKGTVFSSTYFLFCQVQTIYSAISVSLGDASRTGTSIYNGTIVIAHRTRKKNPQNLMIL
jgi:ankyrin repeat protein